MKVEFEDGGLAPHCEAFADVICGLLEGATTKTADPAELAALLRRVASRLRALDRVTKLADSWGMATTITGNARSDAMRKLVEELREALA